MEFDSLPIRRSSRLALLECAEAEEELDSAFGCYPQSTCSGRMPVTCRRRAHLERRVKSGLDRRRLADDSVIDTEQEAS